MNTTIRQSAPWHGFHGTWQIIRFNWPQYVAAVACILIGWQLSASSAMSDAFRDLVLMATGLTGFWTCSSMLASMYVYDVSLLRQWSWLNALLPQNVHRWVSLHAGLDDACPALSSLRPDSPGRSIDIFDAHEMTEPSILRARRSVGAYRAMPGRLTRLPLCDASVDALLLVFVAHEIRRAVTRERFFVELSRVLRPGGSVVLVEHVRDVANFAVFGPGAFHFLSRREWLRVAKSAGLDVVHERHVTPFVRAIVFRRPS